MSLSRTDWILIATAALLLTLAYPPFHMVLPAFVCLVPAALLILRGCRDPEPRQRHLHQGFWYGTITHAVLLYWLAKALWAVGPAATLLFPLAAVMFGGVTAVMFALVGRAVGRSPGRLVLALPAGVVCVEWIASQVGPIALPWHQLALSVSTIPVLVQGADIAGSGGLGFVIAMINTSLALAWWTRSRWKVARAHVEVAGTILLLTTVYGFHRLNTLSLVPAGTVAVVQPNVAVDEKWAPEKKDEVVKRTIHLAEQAIAEARPSLVALPETALPDPLSSRGSWSARLSQLAHRSHTTILAGGIDMSSPGTGRFDRYNAAFAFQPTAGPTALVTHRKQKLVPVVERRLAARPDPSRAGIDGLRPGSTSRIVDSPIGAFGTLLCYELTFDDMARELRRRGAQVLVTLSNDAWFDGTAAPHQHFAHSVLRAVENRVTVVRAANTGLSGIVDPLGRVVVRTDPARETYAVGRVQRSGFVPPAVHLGGFVGPLCAGLLLAMAASVRRGQTSRSPTPPFHHHG